MIHGVHKMRRSRVQELLSMDEGLPVECTKKRGTLEHECRTRLIGLCRLRQSLGGGVQEKGRKKRKEKKDGGVGGERGRASRSDRRGWGGRDGQGGCEAVRGKCAEVEGRTQSAADATIVRQLLFQVANKILTSLVICRWIRVLEKAQCS